MAKYLESTAKSANPLVYPEGVNQDHGTTMTEAVEPVEAVNTTVYFTEMVG
jgi:hypothetical protein